MGQRCELPAKHVASCNNSFNRARKAATKLEHELKAKAPERPLAGTLCAGMLTAPHWRRHSCIQPCYSLLPYGAAARLCPRRSVCAVPPPQPVACGTRPRAARRSMPASMRATRTTAAASHSPSMRSMRRRVSMLRALLGAAHRGTPRHTATPGLLGLHGWLWVALRTLKPLLRAPKKGPIRGRALASANVADSETPFDTRLNIRVDFEGSISYTLVEEDRGNTFDARVWLGRARVEGRDGPPLAPRGGGRFCELTPNAQYRIEVVGTRKEVVVGVAAFGNALKLTEDDSAAGEDKASCSCLWRQHVQKAVLGVPGPA